MFMKTPRTFWPYAIIVVFTCFTAGMATMVVLAFHSNTDLVSRDYYEQELRFQGRIDSLDRTKSLHASAKYNADTKQVVITLPAEHAGKNVEGKIQVYRPSAEGLDRDFQLAPDNKGNQTLDVATLQNGLWRIRVAWTVAGQDYFLEQKLIIGETASASPVRSL